MTQHMQNQCKIAHVVNHVHKTKVKPNVLKNMQKTKCYEKSANMSENVRDQCKIAHVVDHVHKAYVK